MEVHLPRTYADREPGCEQTGPAECNRWEYSQHHAERRVSRCRCTRASTHDPHAPRSLHRICQAGEAAYGSGDRRLDMRERTRIPRKQEKTTAFPSVQSETFQGDPTGPEHTVNEVPSIVQEVLSSSGQPLDSETRAFMEPRFGHDFSQVRVHTDEQAVESAQAVNALAYTV